MESDVLVLVGQKKRVWKFRNGGGMIHLPRNVLASVGLEVGDDIVVVPEKDKLLIFSEKDPIAKLDTKLTYKLLKAVR